MPLFSGLLFGEIFHAAKVKINKQIQNNAAMCKFYTKIFGSLNLNL